MACVPDSPRLGLKPSELRTLVFMIAAAAVLLSVLISLIKSNSAPRDPSPSPLAPLPAPETNPASPIGPTRGGALVPVPVDDPGDEGEDETPAAPGPFREDPGWAEGVIDRTEELEDRAFFHLLHKVSSLPEEELARMAELTLDSIVAMRKSPDLRGRIVRLQGTLIGLRPREFPDNPSRIRNAYEGQMLDIHSKVSSFFVLELPEKFDIMDVVEVRGVYYKIWKYQNRQNAMVECPLVVGKTFRKIPKYVPRKPIRLLGVDLVIGSWQIRMWELVAMTLMIAMAPFTFLVIRREQKRFHQLAQERSEKRISRFKAAALTGAPAPDAASPPAPPAAAASDGAGGAPPGPSAPLSAPGLSEPFAGLPPPPGAGPSLPEGPKEPEGPQAPPPIAP